MTITLIALFAMGLYVLKLPHLIRFPHFQQAKKPIKKTKKQIAEKPHFEFYTLLPGQESTKEEGEYLIQVGAFKRLEDADRLKAQLILQGLKVDIDKVSRNNIVFNRVNIGPYTNLINAKKVKIQLQKNQLHGIIRRIH